MLKVAIHETTSGRLVDAVTLVPWSFPRGQRPLDLGEQYFPRLGQDDAAMQTPKESTAKRRFQSLTW